jgi:hypothetical protein
VVDGKLRSGSREAWGVSPADVLPVLASSFAAQIKALVRRSLLCSGFASASSSTTAAGRSMAAVGVGDFGRFQEAQGLGFFL